MPFTCASFFAGVGGIDLGFEQTGRFETIYANEIDSYPVKTFELNFPLKVDHRSIEDVQPDQILDFDVMLAGFPCLTGDTLVFTEDGYKPITDVKPGDMVLSHDGSYQKVVNFFPQGEKDVYRIKGFGFDSIRATGNHKFFVRKKYRTYPTYADGKRGNIRHFTDPEWKSVDELRAADENNLFQQCRDYYMGTVINQKSVMPVWNGLDCSINDTETVHKQDLDITDHFLWYLAGRYVGDGWLRKQAKDGSKRYPYSGIVICCSDKKLNSFINQIPKRYHYAKSEDSADPSTYKLIFSGIELAAFMLQFGEYADKKKIPGFVFDMPREYLADLIRGYEDADGYIRDKVHSISSVNKTLIYETAMLIEKCYERPVSIYKYKRNETAVIEGRTVNQKDSYELRYKLDSNVQNKAFFENGCIWYPISSIEYAGKEQTYDIQVENTHTFLADNAITHNCTDISIAGLQKGLFNEDGTYTRSGLFFELIRIIHAKRPRIVFLENVKNLVGHNGGQTFIAITDALKSEGYQYRYQVMNAMEYGNVPQNRERIYIVCFRDEEDYEKFSFPDPIPLTRTLHDIIDFDNKMDDKYYYTPGKYKGDIYEKLVEAMDDPNTVYQWRRKYVRKNMSGVVPTLTANQGEGGHNVCLVKTKYGIRKMTPHECFNAQGFPPDFKLPTDMAESRLYKQAGNSVCVSVIRRIAEEIAKVM